MFNRDNRIEDNNTLRRALELARGGTCRSWGQIQDLLIGECRSRVRELLADPWFRKRLNTLCADIRESPAKSEDHQAHPRTTRAIDTP